MLMGDFFYHKVIDPKNPKGLVDLRYIDPRKICKVTEYDQKKPGIEIM